MEIFYQNVNITDRVIVSSAKCRDVSDGRCDSLDIVLHQAATWFNWNPTTDDKIEVTHGGYSTGEMFVSSVIPEDGKYRILATAQKSAARRKARRSFEGKTLEDIMSYCAAECGMEYRIYGIDGKIRYPYMLRKEESCAAFLSRLAKMEGAVLKTYSGRLTMIGIAAAQKIQPNETMQIEARQLGSAYQRKETKYKTLTIKTPYVSVSATDSAASKGVGKVFCDIPAADAATAGRWARGLLLAHNRKADTMTLHTTFHSTWSAMVRIDITGDTEANGQWIIDEVEHDFIENTSWAVMLRCIESVS